MLRTTRTDMGQQATESISDMAPVTKRLCKTSEGFNQYLRHTLTDPCVIVG